MNKSKKRAIEKHRAKARKFEARRKEGGSAGYVPGEASAATRSTGATSKPRASQRTPEPALAAASTEGEQPEG